MTQAEVLLQSVGESVQNKELRKLVWTVILKGLAVMIGVIVLFLFCFSFKKII